MKKLPDFFWTVFCGTNGAFSCSEAIALYNIALQAPEGRCAEFGVFKGKSAMSAAAALKNSLFYLIEPEFKDEAFAKDVIDTLEKIKHQSVELSVRATTSIEFLNDYKRKFVYVFIDSGDHQSLPMQEVKLLEDKMDGGGIVAFHDVFAQFLQVTEAYNYLLSTGKYEEIKINWDEINAYVKEHDLERDNNSWHHQELESPNFLGALRRK